MAEAIIPLVVPHTEIMQINMANRISIRIDRLQAISTVDKKETSDTSALRRIEKGIQIPQETTDPTIKIGEEIIRVLIIGTPRSLEIMVLDPKALPPTVPDLNHHQVTSPDYLLGPRHPSRM